MIAGVAYGLWKVIDQRTRESPLEWTPQPFPSPPMPVPHTPGAPPAAAPPPAVAAPAAAWVEPTGGACPASHPVKAKLASGIFHVPGGQMYDRTVPDRCYADAEAATDDGLRASKR